MERTRHFFFLFQKIQAEEPWQVTVKAWNAMGKKDLDSVEKLANHANRVWGELARKTNKQIAAVPSSCCNPLFLGWLSHRIVSPSPNPPLCSSYASIPGNDGDRQGPDQHGQQPSPF